MSIFDFPERDAVSGPFEILTVCTGNICRSPLAEMALRTALARLPVRISSAGTMALVGDAMPSENIEIAEELGLPNATDHRGTQLKEDHVRAADLILVMSREHRAHVVQLVPRAVRVTFTIREFARLTRNALSEGAVQSLNDTSPQRMRQAIEAVAQIRGTVPGPEDKSEDDVVDPYRRELAIYRESAQQLIPAVNATAAFLRNASSSPIGGKYGE